MRFEQKVLSLNTPSPSALIAVTDETYTYILPAQYLDMHCSKLFRVTLKSCIPTCFALLNNI